MLETQKPPLESQVSALSVAELAPMVRAALGGAHWTPAQWHVQRLHRTYGTMTGGIFRVAGVAQADGQTQPWSLILKVVSPAAWQAMTAAEPMPKSHPLYWKREVLVYQSGWLDRLPGGIRGPRCYASVEQSDGTIWLWLEEAQDCFGEAWPLEQYARAARCLGRFNGAYLGGEPRPPFGWLGQVGSPRGVIEHYRWIEPLVRDPSVWEHPLLRATFPPALIARLPRFWDERHKLLDALERLPQTVCHQDAWRGNVYSPRGTEDELVLIDWAYVGYSVLGSDLADLAVAGYNLLAVAPPPAAIDAAVFSAYLDGVRAAGCQTPREAVRYAYITCAALKYGCLLIWLRDMADEQRLGSWDRLAGQPAPAWLEKQAVVLEHQLHLLEEALTLVPRL